MQIGSKTFDEISALVNELLKYHEEPLNRAYLEMEEDKDYSISFTIKIRPGVDGNNVWTEISYLPQRKIKDGRRRIVNENQRSFLKDAE